MTRLHWKALITGTRHERWPALEQAISRHAFLVDFRLFSDVAMSLTLELDASQLAPLCDALALQVEWEEPPTLPERLHAECQVMLHLTFGGGTGNLAHEVPAVPG